MTKGSAETKPRKVKAWALANKSGKLHTDKWGGLFLATKKRQAQMMVFRPGEKVVAVTITAREGQ